MTPSKIFLYFCLSFVGGIFLGSFLEISQLLWLSFLVLGLVFISVFWKYKKLVIVGFFVLFLILGVWRQESVETQNAKLKSQNYNGEAVVLTGIIINEPEVKEKSQRLTIKTEKTKILITTQRYPEYRYGDKLKITGKLETPPVLEEFNYRDYLEKDGIFSLSYFPEIELLGSNLGNPIYAALFSFKNKFKGTVQSFISPPQVGILEALVFGEEDNIAADWKEKLNLTGTRHIAAVSGMNITIISAVILDFLLAFGLWRQQAFYLSIMLIVLYILLIGAPASAVRAGIMGILFLTAQHFGRLSSASRAIVFAACLMLFFNPLLLKSDVGFHLSFLAMMGIIYLPPIFSDFFEKIPNPKLFLVRTTLAATLSAQVFTLPILIYNFGYISLMAPVANILIVPFLAPLTIFIFVFGLSGMIFQVLAWVVFPLVWLGLAYLIQIIDFFSKIPLAVLRWENVSCLWLIIYYLVLGVLVQRIQESRKLSFLKY